MRRLFRVIRVSKIHPYRQLEPLWKEYATSQLRSRKNFYLYVGNILQKSTQTEEAFQALIPSVELCFPLMCLRTIFNVTVQYGTYKVRYDKKRCWIR